MIGKSAVQKAEAEVERLVELVARWESEAAAKRAELDDLRARLGDEVLADESAAERLSGQMQRLATMEGVAVAAAHAAGRQLGNARRVVLRERAAELRVDAQVLREEADKLEKRMAKPLAELAELGGVEFGPMHQFNPLGTSAHCAVPLTRPAVMRLNANDMDLQAAALTAQAGAPSPVRAGVE